VTVVNLRYGEGNAVPWVGGSRPVALFLCGECVCGSVRVWFSYAGRLHTVCLVSLRVYLESKRRIFLFFLRPFFCVFFLEEADGTKEIVSSADVRTRA